MAGDEHVCSDYKDGDAKSERPNSEKQLGSLQKYRRHKKLILIYV